MESKNESFTAKQWNVWWCAMKWMLEKMRPLKDLKYLNKILNLGLEWENWLAICGDDTR